MNLRDEFVPDHVKVHAQKSYYQGVIFETIVDDVEFKSGERTTREYILHDDAVGILPIRINDENLEVLLINQYRHPGRRRYWELPAGLRDKPGEELLLCAQRELAEETQMSAKHWEHFLSYDSSPGCMVETLDLFIAFDPEVDSRLAADFIKDTEEAEMIQQWFSLDEVYAAVRSGDLKSPTLVAGILAAKLDESLLKEKIFQLRKA
ncbi:MAG: NUDIX hydrolase [Arcanobacterium sp.]|nr:NUDIX hydrolase [Arcanobacterium sp.]